MPTMVLYGVRHEFDDDGFEQICTVTVKQRKFPRREAHWTMGGFVQEWSGFQIEYAEYPVAVGLNPLRRCLVQSVRELCPDWEAGEDLRWDKLRLTLTRSGNVLEECKLKSWLDAERWLFDRRLTLPYHALFFSYLQDKSLFITQAEHDAWLAQVTDEISSEADSAHRGC